MGNRFVASDPHVRDGWGQITIDDLQNSENGMLVRVPAPSSALRLIDLLNSLHAAAEDARRERDAAVARERGANGTFHALRNARDAAIKERDEARELREEWAHDYRKASATALRVQNERDELNVRANSLRMENDDLRRRLDEANGRLTDTVHARAGYLQEREVLDAARAVIKAGVWGDIQYERLKRFVDACWPPEPPKWRVNAEGYGQYSVKSDGGMDSRWYSCGGVTIAEALARAEARCAALNEKEAR